MVNSKAIYCSTPSATCSTCSTSTRGSWQNRWGHQAELVNQGATYWFFYVFVLHFVNDCTMHDAFIWRAAIRLSSLEADLPWLTMTCAKWHMKAKVLNPARVPYLNQSNLTLQTPSRSNSLGQEKRLLQTPIVPKCKPTKSQIKGQCHRKSLKRRD